MKTDKSGKFIAADLQTYLEMGKTHTDKENIMGRC